MTFGGAYAVLTYMAQDVVQNKAWLSATEMMDGLGMAETTPGPLILVTSFAVLDLFIGIIVDAMQTQNADKKEEAPENADEIKKQDLRGELINLKKEVQELSALIKAEKSRDQ